MYAVLNFTLPTVCSFLVASENSLWMLNLLMHSVERHVISTFIYILLRIYSIPAVSVATILFPVIHKFFQSIPALLMC